VANEFGLRPQFCNVAIRIFNFRPQIKDAEDVFDEYGHFFVFLVSITHDQGQGKFGSQTLCKWVWRPEISWEFQSQLQLFHGCDVFLSIVYIAQ
jgi:hypothetical protein